MGLEKQKVVATHVIKDGEGGGLRYDLLEIGLVRVSSLVSRASVDVGLAYITTPVREALGLKSIEGQSIG